MVPLEQDSAADMSLKPATEYADPIERSRAQYRAAERQANAERKIENNAFDYSSDINMLEWDRIFEMVKYLAIDIMLCIPFCLQRAYYFIIKLFESFVILYSVTFDRRKIRK